DQRRVSFFQDVRIATDGQNQVEHASPFLPVRVSCLASSGLILPLSVVRCILSPPRLPKSQLQNAGIQDSERTQSLGIFKIDSLCRSNLGLEIQAASWRSATGRLEGTAQRWVSFRPRAIALLPQACAVEHSDSAGRNYWDRSATLPRPSGPISPDTLRARDPAHRRS